MAKKINLNFSKVEERSGWNSKHMPEGLHRASIVAVDQTEAQDGTAMLVYALVPSEARFKTRRFPYYCKLQQNQLWKLRDLLVSAGESVPKKAVSIDPNKVVGREVAIEVEDDNYQGNLRSQVNGVYGVDILDDEDAGQPQYADDEEAEEEAYDDEELEEAEEDLSTMSLAELRKAAKAAGIDTAGLKKADLIEALEEEGDEDDDLGDEELDDEDLDDDEGYEDEEDEEEDEEEEPEPAPKRRARSKAAPAKAAAKRTVKRR